MMMEEAAAAVGGERRGEASHEAAPFMVLLSVFFSPLESWEEQKAELLRRCILLVHQRQQSGRPFIGSGLTITRKRSRTNSFSVFNAASSSSSLPPSASSSSSAAAAGVGIGAGSPGKRRRRANSDAEDETPAREKSALENCRPMFLLVCLADALQHHCRKKSSESDASAGGAAEVESLDSDALLRRRVRDHESILRWCEEFVNVFEAKLATACSSETYLDFLNLSEIHRHTIRSTMGENDKSHVSEDTTKWQERS
uniref:E3 ubiquitin ligase UBR4 C-terminal domain-containing protein n=1 Tax=Octactis speculum TaxID=3111310 RepID=A0A7S2BPT9_9STRA|mmetsp:Transcript_25695/g.35348  ORF Transcript_25695/g.35348 Transcript_25695/m.35348 type:complete len:256 (+) Transcript_25695:3-770(+)